MSSAVAKAQRHLELERLIRKRLSLAQIATQLRVSLKTVKRDLAARRENMLAEIGGEQAVIRDYLIRESFEDLDALAQKIKRSEEEGVDRSMVVSDFYRNRATIRRDLARMIGAEQPARHLHLHTNTGPEQTTQAIGPIRIVYGPSVYPDDDSGELIGIELPKAPEDRANCHPDTVRLADEIDRKRRANHGINGQFESCQPGAR
jgi:hypothetical protein